LVCFGIIGKPRTGKTLFLTAIGANDFESGRKLYSNYDLYSPLTYTHYDIDDLLSISTMEMEISPKTVLIQEASKWFDARRSSRNENVLLSSFTGQSGKRDIDIYYDDQFITRIDRGLRDITDFSFVSNCVYDSKKNPLMFEYEMYGGYFAYPMNRTLRFPVSIMSKFFNLYDTRQPTQPLQKIKVKE